MASKPRAMRPAPKAWPLDYLSIKGKTVNVFETVYLTPGEVRRMIQWLERGAAYLEAKDGDR